MSTTRINCEQSREWMSEQLDGELDAVHCSSLSAHLEACPGCRALLQDLRSARALLADEGTLAMPAAASTRLRQAMETGLDEPLVAEDRLRPAATAAMPAKPAARPARMGFWTPRWAGGWAAVIVLLVLAVGVVRWRAAAVTTSGWLIDRSCLASFATHPADHTRDCLLRCAKKTYGVVDAKGHFTPFDARGTQRAIAAVEASDKPDHLWVTVTGKKSSRSAVLEVEQIELTDPDSAARY